MSLTQRQIPLDLAFPLDWRFDRFQVSAQNAQAVAAVERMADGEGEAKSLLLWGPAAVGKTHLLAAAAGLASAWTWAPWLDVAELATRQCAPDALSGLESAGLLCLDGVDAVCGQRDWEESLFHLHNRLQACGGSLLMSSSQAPSALSWTLPDWASRVGAALVYRLHPLRDEDLLCFLQSRAAQKGLDLPAEAGNFILQRHARDLPALCRLLDQLDRAALAAARRLTVPFLRSVLPQYDKHPPEALEYDALRKN